MDKWMDAKKRSPAIHEAVLLYHRDGFQAIGHLEKNWDDSLDWWWSDMNDSSAYDSFEITHWQPLPESPRKT